MAQPAGRVVSASARRALPGLAAQLSLSLPAAQSGPPREGCVESAVESGLSLPVSCGSLSALGEVRLRVADPVADTAAEPRLCGALLSAEHPLGRERDAA